MTAKAPFEAEKPESLHDQGARPGYPDGWQAAWRMYLGLGLLGIALAAGGAALVFELRDGWESHRDWVPPAGIVGATAGALAFAYLLWRGRLVEMTPGVGLLVATLAFTLIGWSLERNDGRGAAQDAMTILGTVSLALTCMAFVGGFIWAEARSPARPPAPEAQASG